MDAEHTKLPIDDWIEKLDSATGKLKNRPDAHTHKMRMILRKLEKVRRSFLLMKVSRESA